MNRQLVFVHGRAQENMDADALKADWIAAWREGLAKSGLEVPIAESNIRFPYYGQTLFDLVEGVADAAAVIVRGESADREEQEFILSMLQELRRGAGVSDEQVAEEADGEVLRRGALNWGWVQAIMTALDKNIPGASSASIALATYDVYHYLKNPGVRDEIETGVRQAITAGRETVVVGHSLGSVVSYALLKREGAKLGWKVPLYVTLGSPLAVTAIRKALAPLAMPEAVTHWFNAMDEQDVVSLYPLDEKHFGVAGIENKTDVDNRTPNQHGISGYLGDAEVARRIHEALVAS